MKYSTCCRETIVWPDRVDTMPACLSCVSQTTVTSVLRMGNSRRGPGYTAVLRFLNRYLINFEGAGSSTIKSDLRLCVRPLRGNLGRSRLCQKALLLDHQIICRKSDVESLLFHFYGLLLKNAALDGGLVRRPGLLHSDISVCDF